MPFTSITDRQTDGLESRLNKIAERLLTQSKSSIRMKAMETVTAAPAAPAPKKQPTLKELFAQRDATQPGSKEEDQAVENIIGAMFPNAR